MAALGDTSAPGMNGLIQQFTAITGKNKLILSFVNHSLLWVLIKDRFSFHKT